LAGRKSTAPGGVAFSDRMAIRPIFLFSVSRSGSTLVQRVIAAHDGVATVSEPWLLLPYAYSLRGKGIDAEYFHPLLATAIGDFCRELDEGVDAYRREHRRLALRLYESAARAQERDADGGAASPGGGGARYFLDKSPSYYLIAEEVMRTFPEGKFVFLWRNPLSVMASIMETFNEGRWHPTVGRGDLFLGLPRLTAAYRSNRGRAHAVRFEDLLDGDERPWRELMGYLEIEFEPQALRRFSQVRLSGRMGDPTDGRRHATLDSATTQKWKQTLANPLRKEWCRRYLEFLGPERLRVMGYEPGELARELEALPATARSLLPDTGGLLIDLAKEPVRVRIRGRGIGGPNVIRELLASRASRTIGHEACAPGAGQA
jgi:hypothetical protein